MPTISSITLLFLSAFNLLSMHASAGSAISRSHYTNPHSLGAFYKFDPRDGWETANVTNLHYKYKRSGNAWDWDSDAPNVQSSRRLVKRSPKGSTKNQKHVLHDHSIGGAIKHVLDDVFKGLKGIGRSQAAIVTWYTGHDLQNPSCWANTDWAPTDESFVCALTLEGWTTRPKCFSFLELCNGPKKCVFVRVVDTCAGCQRGSKHIDLTRKAFSSLLDLDVGRSTVQWRHATEPAEWYNDLWGPKSD